MGMQRVIGIIKQNVLQTRLSGISFLKEKDVVIERFEKNNNNNNNNYNNNNNNRTIISSPE